ncbi:hypothetical protein C8A01DRAFT_40154, partial [Parachaetomium inaequale]
TATPSPPFSRTPTTPSPKTTIKSPSATGPPSPNSPPRGKAASGAGIPPPPPPLLSPPTSTTTASPTPRQGSDWGASSPSPACATSSTRGWASRPRTQRRWSRRTGGPCRGRCGSWLGSGGGTCTGRGGSGRCGGCGLRMRRRGGVGLTFLRAGRLGLLWRGVWWVGGRMGLTVLGRGAWWAGRRRGWWRSRGGRRRGVSRKGVRVRRRLRSWLKRGQKRRTL